MIRKNKIRQNNTGYESEEEVVQTASSSGVNKRRRILNEFAGYAMVLLAAFMLYFMVSRFVLINSYVPTDSMEPVIMGKSRFFGNRLAYLFEEPDRGDVVVVNHKCYDGEKAELLVKRIVGLPGDRIEIRDGKLYINDEIYEEKYICEEMKEDFLPVEIPRGCYFLLGDNRNNSDDSRWWEYKFIPEDEIVAKAMFVYYPKFSSIK